MSDLPPPSEEQKRIVEELKDNNVAVDAQVEEAKKDGTNTVMERE